tara:strand:+ start:287 stop:1180 length:894 start_codon:yes stop_codon:yes gene_type:complete
MVAKLVLDQLEKTGGALTALTLPVANATASQYLQNNGSGVLNWSTVTAASTNVQRATGDVTIGTTAGYDIDGTTEIVVACNAGAANRTITLPAVGAAGAATCIITVIADLDATSTYKLTVLESDGSTEVWTGYQTGDFVRLIVSNSAWLVVDHKETYYSYRWLTASATIGTSATTKLTGWTNVIDIGNVWDNANNKLTTPTGMNGFWLISWNNSTGTETNGVTPTVQLAGNSIMKYAHTSGTSGYLSGQDGVTGKYYATSTQDVEFFATNMRSDYTHIILGGGQSTSHFTAQFERVY